MVEILYFAWVREQVGQDAEQLELPAHLATVTDLLDWLASRSPGHAAALADRSRIRTALDQQFASPETALAGAREIAIFPPVTGG
jgi:molybdopterin synthase sulfur carrier subunit